MIRITTFWLALVVVAAMAFFAPAATFAADNTDSAIDAVPTKTAAEAVPMIVVAPPKHEFPPVLEGEYVTHTFRVANQGTADLEVIRVRTG